MSDAPDTRFRSDRYYAVAATAERRRALRRSRGGTRADAPRQAALSHPHGTGRSARPGSGSDHGRQRFPRVILWVANGLAPLASHAGAGDAAGRPAVRREPATRASGTMRRPTPSGSPATRPRRDQPPRENDRGRLHLHGVKPADAPQHRGARQRSARSRRQPHRSGRRRRRFPLGTQAIARHYSLPRDSTERGKRSGSSSSAGRSIRRISARLCTLQAFGPRSHERDHRCTNGAFSDELAIDTQVAGVFAHGAGIKLYFGENSMRGWLDALVTALTDERAAPSIVSMSFGQPESRLSRAQIAVLRGIFIAAVLVGITVIVASGDAGPICASPDGSLTSSIRFESFVLACGGTVPSSRDGRISGERVWNSSGKAIAADSARARPCPRGRNGRCAGLQRYRGEYSGMQGRGTPDLLAMAAPGYPVLRAGVHTAGGGTSAVAPFVAALVARINQRSTVRRPDSSCRCFTQAEKRPNVPRDSPGRDSAVRAEWRLGSERRARRTEGLGAAATPDGLNAGSLSS